MCSASYVREDSVEMANPSIFKLAIGQSDPEFSIIRVSKTENRKESTKGKVSDGIQNDNS